MTGYLDSSSKSALLELGNLPVQQRIQLKTFIFRTRINTGLLDLFFLQKQEKTCLLKIREDL
jgi:hypothetical protein